MDRGGGAHHWGTGRAMRMGRLTGSSNTPELLPIEFYHFLVLASDAALPDFVDIWPWNFSFSIYFNSFSISRSSSLKRSCNLVYEELNERLVLTEGTNFSPIEACFYFFI